MPRIPRLTIGRLMLAVVMVAVNIAVGRLVFAWSIWGVEILLAFAPMSLVIQFTVLMALRCRGRARAFWTGFIAFAVASMATLAESIVNTRGILDILWGYYMDFALQVFDCLPHILQPDFERGYSLALCFRSATIWFLPQLLAGLIGGFLAWLAAGRRREEMQESA